MTRKAEQSAVPADDIVYEFIDDFEQWLKPRLAKLITPREALQPVPEDML